MSDASSLWTKPSRWVDPTTMDCEIVTELLGKVPRGEFSVVARNENGQPRVIENAPFFDDGTPMPTRYWLVEPELVADVSRVESAGGVKLAEQEIDSEVIAAIHALHEKQREALIDPHYDGPRPTGGVGGTRKGVKCLHTHVANLYGSGNDAVGEWTLNKISELKAHVR